MSRKIFIRLTKKVSFLQILPVITPFHKRQELYLTVIPFFLSFLNDGSLTLLLLFKKSPFHPCSSPHPDTLQTAFTTFSISFPFLHLFHSTSQPLYLPMDIHRSICSLLIAEWYAAPSRVLLRPMAMTCPVWALDSRASSFSYLSLNCSYSVFLIDDFSGRSESHLLFPSQS